MRREFFDFSIEFGYFGGLCSGGDRANFFNAEAQEAQRVAMPPRNLSTFQPFSTLFNPAA